MHPLLDIDSDVLLIQSLHSYLEGENQTQIKSKLRLIQNKDQWEVHKYNFCNQPSVQQRTLTKIFE